MLNWFAVSVELDHTNYTRNRGIRLYDKENYEYRIITGLSYIKESNTLIVQDENRNIIELVNEPNNVLFTETVEARWYAWDYGFGDEHGVNRNRFRPKAFKSIKSLAYCLNKYRLSPGEHLDLFN